MRVRLGAGLVGALAVGLVTAAPAAVPRTARVGRVVDGDTLALTDGLRVRLVQIDKPELGSGECYSHAAARVLGRLTPPGSTVGLEADPAMKGTVATAINAVTRKPVLISRTRKSKFLIFNC